MYKSLNSEYSISSKQPLAITEIHELGPISKNCQTASYPLLYPIIALLLLIGAGFASLAVVLRLQLSEWAELCHCEACYITAGEMLSRMDTHTHPCQDFYEFSCGRYSRTQDETQETNKRTLFWEATRRTEISLKSLLEQPDDNSTLSSSDGVAKARLYYTACMRQDYNGSQLLLSIIQSLGGWPLHKPRPPSPDSAWRADSWSLEAALSRAHGLSINVLFSVSVAVDERKTSEHVLLADQAGLMFKSSQVYLSSDSSQYRDAYLTYFTDVARLLNVEQQVALRYAEDVWEFERTLAGAFMTLDERLDPVTLYHLVTVSDIERMMSGKYQLNITTLLSEITGHQISARDPLVLRAPQYLHRLAQTLHMVRPHTLSSYIVWCVLREVAPHAGHAFRAAHQRMQAAVTVTQAPPLWAQCVRETSEAMGVAVGGLYAERFLSLAEREMIDRLIRQIVNEFTGHLAQLDWMDMKTRSKVRRKAEAIDVQIGSPGISASSHLIDQFYTDLNVSDNPLENNINSRLFERRRNSEKIGTVPDKNEWHVRPTEVNAYYRPTTNQITVTAGILQKPFFDIERPASIMFGAMGFIVAHELMHGFDTSGRSYDAHGNMIDWWSEEISREYTRRAQCFQDEYNTTYKGLSLNPLLTLNENIADNGGARLAYHAYQSWREGRAQEAGPGLTDRSLTDDRLPGLNLTTDQQWFVSMAQLWCSVSTQRQLEDDVMTSRHSISKVRVNTVVRNMKEFSEAFKCDVNAAMNSRRPCRIW